MRIAARHLIAAIVVAAASASLAAPAAAAPWRVVQTPFASGIVVRDLSVVGTTGVAVAGDSGAVAVSMNGGATWLQMSVTGMSPLPRLNAVAFTDSTHGVVGGDAGLLLVTDDSGATWRAAAIEGATTADILDLALAGSVGYAVGRGGLVLRTVDAGETWQAMSSHTTADLTSVAMDATGQAIAGGAGGTIVTASAGVWSHVTDLPAPVTDVALRRPAGVTTAFATTSSVVVSSTDLTNFEPVLEPGLHGSFPVVSLSLLDLPRPVLVLASSSGGVALFTLSDGIWVPQTSPVTTATVVRSPSGQGTAYVLAPPGKVLRTLSAGGEPLIAKASGSVVKTGSPATVSVTSRVLAPGGLALLKRTAGTGTWQDVDRVPWMGRSTATVPFDVSPIYTTDYQAAFAFNGALVEWSNVVRIAVRPRITPAKTLFELRRGSIYRLRGTVGPKLSGESVQIWTDRGGRWHKVQLGGTVKLVDGTSFRSRAFGCPISEDYHLLVKMVSAARHAAGSSPLITVRIR